MSSVLSEYPDTLPAPMVGVVVPTERRRISNLPGVQNFRTVQRDRHGTRTYAFTFTRAQAAIFREWWAEWEQRGGGWFAANWPLPWSRGPNVFRFKAPPSWSMIGGGNDGQGYWRLSGTVEIRGRGMLPTVEVMYLTSTPYPIESVESMGYASAHVNRIKIDPISTFSKDAMGILAPSLVEITTRNTRHDIFEEDSIIYNSLEFSVAVRVPIKKLTVVESIIIDAPVTTLNMRRALISYRIPDGESVKLELSSIVVTKL
ncbi:MAG: hypothetical protein [Caudoviricetes sp.]|nr:MAG: hypothetical protein [Caudoviricetes sp.]